jgi:putative peptide zinc metalloprotease protein
LRAVAFFVSTTAIILSLLVNLSPFMRFDGYHMLADSLGAHNLGPRAFALARWKMRELLFGLGSDRPERLPRTLTGFLIAYSWGTWIYRFSLFLGIAVVVYHLFPKAVGIPMFLVEIIFFIALPIIRELKEWWQMDRKALRKSAVAWRSFAVVLGLMILAVLPLDRHIQVPAVLVPRYEANIFAPEPSQVLGVKVRYDEIVSPGQILLVLSSPRLNSELTSVDLRLQITRERLSRVTVDAKERQLFAILTQEEKTLKDEREGLLQREALLTVRAAAAGKITDVMVGLAAGAWVGHNTSLMHIAGQGGAELAGLGDVLQSERLKVGASAWFVSEDGLHSAVVGQLKSIGVPVSSGAEFTYLSSLNGGSVGMARDPKTGEPAPINGVLPLRFTAALAQTPATSLRGVALVQAEPESFMGMALNRFAAVFLRESGF